MKYIKILRKYSVLMVGLQMLLLLTTNAFAAKKIDPPWQFKGGYLVSISDSDMIASAYVDGQLGPREGQDKLSIIDLAKPVGHRQAIEVPASNSVAGPPAALSIDAAGRYAYVIETFTPRPAGDEEHSFKDLKWGNLLTVYDLSDKNNPELVAKHKIGSRPDSVDISPDGKWLLVSFYPSLTQTATAKPLAIYKMDAGHIKAQYFPELPHWNPESRLISAVWSPDGKVIAMINTSQAEVTFFRFHANTASIQQWGNTVAVGKAPFLGRFSHDGKHFLVNNLFWGPDVQGTWNEAPNGTIVNITLDNGQNDKIRHALSSHVMTGPSPEGFAVSPSGNFVAALNMERSWLPYNDPRQSGFSSITLIKRDPETGAMNTLQTLPYDGILPESAVFDVSGEHLAVATFDHYDHSIKGGSIDFFRIVADPLNAEKKMLMQTNQSISVTRGVHTLQLIK